MNSIRIIAILAGLFLMSVGTVFAGDGPTETTIIVTAECDSLTVTWGPSGFGGSSDVFASIDGVTLFDRFEEGSGGTITRPIVPALTGLSLIEVRVTNLGNMFPTIEMFSLDCREGEDAVVLGAEYIQLCNDGRTNINLCEPLAIYPVSSSADEGTGMVIYSIPRGTSVGTFELYIAAEDFEALPTAIESACVINASADGDVVVYLLPTGEIQVNGGPDEEDKVFVYRYSTFPSRPEVETYFGAEALPTSPAC